MLCGWGLTPQDVKTYAPFLWQYSPVCGCLHPETYNVVATSGSLLRGAGNYHVMTVPHLWN